MWNPTAKRKLSTWARAIDVDDEKLNWCNTFWAEIAADDEELKLLGNAVVTEQLILLLLKSRCKSEMSLATGAVLQGKQFVQTSDVAAKAVCR